MKCILGLSAVAGVLLLATTASARPPEIDQLWRPPPRHTEKVRKDVKSHVPRAVVRDQRTTKPMPRFILKPRKYGDLFDDYSRPSRPGQRTTKAADRGSLRDAKKLKHMLESRLKERMRCGDHDDCGVTLRRTPTKSDEKKRPSSRTREYIDKRVKMRMERIEKMLLPGDPMCKDAAECMI